MHGTYNLWLVALSLVVATLASYTALDLSRRIALLANGRSRFAWLAGGATVSMRPRITAKRQQIDNRFPFLAFAIDTLGLPLYEVLLTTDRALFSPSRKA
ncbi:hypothetical protein WI37_20795, partial [Burkholderia ubonensis]